MDSDYRARKNTKRKRGKKNILVSRVVRDEKYADA